MTLEEMFECSDPSLLEKITDVELKAHFEPFLNVTRPELVVKKSVGREPERIYTSPNQQKTLKFLEEQGLDVSLLMRKRKKL